MASIEGCILALSSTEGSRSEIDLAHLVGTYSALLFRVAHSVVRSRSLALRELSAASLPAPPLPLTEQEKLLLRVAHTGDPEQLAMLNPEVRRKWEAEGDAEFQSFFEQSK